MRWIIGVLATAAVLVAAASFSRIAEAVNPDEAMLRLLPADAEGVLFVDVARLRGSELFESWRGDRERVPQAVEEFSRQTGLDLESGVEQVALGWRERDAILAVVRARHDPRRIEEHLQSRAVESESYGGYRLYAPSVGAAFNRDDWRLTFLNGLILMGPRPVLERAIDRVGAGSSTVLDNPVLMDDIRSIEDGYQIWTVGNLGVRMLPDGLAPPMATDLLESFRGGTYQMKLDTGVDGLLVGKFANPEAARRTSDLLQGLLVLGRMQAGRQEEMIRFLDGVQIAQATSTVQIRFAADGDLLRQLRSSLSLPIIQ